MHQPLVQRLANQPGKEPKDTQQVQASASKQLDPMYTQACDRSCAASWSYLQAASQYNQLVQDVPLPRKFCVTHVMTFGPERQPLAYKETEAASQSSKAGRKVMLT